MGEVRKPLLGNEIVFSERADRYNFIRRKYLELSVEAKKKVSDYYDSSIKSISDFRSRCLGGVTDIFNQYLKIGVLEMISHEIYDIDEVVLKEEILKNFPLEYVKAIKDVTSEFNRIDNEQAAADEARKELISEAGNSVETSVILSSGNLGEDLGNVAQSAVEDLAINAIMAGGTALITGGVRAVEKKMAEKEKQEIFERSSNKQSIMIGIAGDVAGLYKTIARLINERCGEYFYYPEEETLSKLEPVCRNILGGNFKHEASKPRLEEDKIQEVLTVNPYEIRIYTYIMKSNDGLSDEVKSLLDYLCIDMHTMADCYLNSIYNIYDYETYEEMAEFEEVVKKEMVPFEVEDCDFYYEMLDEKQRLYDIRRTFRGCIYESIEERDRAEEQFTSFFKEGEILSEMEMDELVSKYYETLKPEYTEKNREDLQAMLMLYINKRLEDYTDSLIVEGYIDQAETKKAEYAVEKMSLLDSLNRRLKKLVRKEKISAMASSAKEGAIATAAAAKNMGKDLFDKIPIGKKNETEAALPEDLTRTSNPSYEAYDKTVQATSEPVGVTSTSDNGNSGGANIMGGAKNMFAGAANKIKSGASNITENIGTKQCPSCGGPVKITGKFCGSCGYRF